MDEEEEDRVLLNTLGVTSANPEDIERDILQKVAFTHFSLYLLFTVSTVLDTDHSAIL